MLFLWREIEYFCTDCEASLMIDKINKKMYCKRCDKEYDLRFTEKIELKIPFIRCINFECDIKEFQRYKL